MSCACPPPFFASVVLSILFALSPLSCRVFADGIYPLHVVALTAGASPHVLGSVGTHGVRGGSTYIALHRTWSVSAVLTSAPLGLRSVFTALACGPFPHVFMAIGYSVSLNYACPSLKSPVGLCYLDT